MYRKRGDYVYPEESKKIKQACAQVWKTFGGAFKEQIVDRALTQALEQEGLVVEDQKRINITYNGVTVGAYVIDKVVNEKVIIEMKSKVTITPEDIKQLWYYLKASEYKVGYLINFSPTHTQIIRRVYDTARRRS